MTDIDELERLAKAANVERTLVSDWQDYYRATEPACILDLCAEVRRLRNLLACRPALNNGLIEAYSQWTAVVYDSEAARAKEEA
jgi:hypothetical protein